MKALPCAAAIAAILAISATDARATSTMGCNAIDNSGAWLEMNLSNSLPVDKPDWVQISDGKEQWSTREEGREARSAYVLQSFDDGTLFSLDLADDQSEIIAKVRILSVDEGQHFVRQGVIHFPGRSVHPITCDYGDE